MKRAMTLICAAALCFALVACGGGETTKEVNIQEVADKLAQEVTFRDELAQVDAEIARQRYNVGEDVNIVMYRGSGATAEEIAVLEAKDDASAKAVKAAVDQRVLDIKDAFENYIPEEKMCIRDRW